MKKTLSHLLFSLHRTLDRAVRERARLDELTVAQVETLEAIDTLRAASTRREEKEPTFTELSAFLGSDLSTMSRNVPYLEKKGLIERVQKSDGRRTGLRVTSRGAIYLKHIHSYYFVEIGMLLRDSPNRTRLLEALTELDALTSRQPKRGMVLNPPLESLEEGVDMGVVEGPPPTSLSLLRRPLSALVEPPRPSLLSSGLVQPPRAKKERKA